MAFKILALHSDPNAFRTRTELFLNLTDVRFGLREDWTNRTPGQVRGSDFWQKTEPNRTSATLLQGVPTRSAVGMLTAGNTDQLERPSKDTRGLGRDDGVTWRGAVLEMYWTVIKLEYTILCVNITQFGKLDFIVTVVDMDARRGTSAQQRRVSELETQALWSATLSRNVERAKCEVFSKYSLRGIFESWNL
ncbi:hypothetical protein DFH09DRAFT_1085961 [Mycena vulgaris]|nr:hypothetical protein DFH09DRAFT_1085961 [Mycena vulgaris]